MAIFILGVSLGHSEFDGSWREGTDSRGRAGVLARIYYNGVKTIKYCNFSCAPVNRVDDYEACVLTGKVETNLRITGPIQASPYYQEFKFDNVWKNSNIYDILQSDVDIQFMDGSMATVTVEQMKEFLPKAQQEMNETKKKDDNYKWGFSVLFLLGLYLLMKGFVWIVKSL